MVPLSTKLLACMMVLLAVCAAGITFSIRQLVGSYLLQKTDTQLAEQAQLVYDNIDVLRNKDSSEQGSVGPNDYFMQIRDTDNRILNTPLVPVMREDVISMPRLPADGSMGDVKIGEPFTTSSEVRATNGSSVSRSTLQAASAPWRVLALSWGKKTADGGAQIQGVIYIGLSLNDQIDTVNTLTKYCTLVSIAIVLVGAVIATVLIQSTLAPLKRIEKTAAKIAAGDLSQRVPSAPENTEVGSLAASLNTMLARIEHSFNEQQETTEKMKRFVSDASHELRTPLAAIHGYAELYTLQRDMPGALERADESISHIEASSARMTVLVEDLLSLARLDEGRGIDITQQVPITAQVNDACDDLHALDPQRGITKGVLQLRHGGENQGTWLSFSPDDLPQVTLTGDGSRLRQVITNIVGNIHRYTPPDSPVEVGLSVLSASIAPNQLSHLASNGKGLTSFLEAAEVGQSLGTGIPYAVIRFADHGPGVPEASQSQIFERFYTADPSRARQKGGTGLGMAIAQSVVKAHRGLVSATTTPGGGLTLTVILPLDPAQTAAPAKPGCPAAGLEQAGSRGRKPKNDRRRKDKNPQAGRK
ncbi:HAMP domain-containing sensor histidine kinase [Bifidobacterium thermophilum]|uniref:sensor histidine kinase n=1 Tax=Bifidobacterium thermophilum TaxID=33905 RepID=UPI0030A550E0